MQHELLCHSTHDNSILKTYARGPFRQTQIIYFLKCSVGQLLPFFIQVGVHQAIFCLKNTIWKIFQQNFPWALLNNGMLVPQSTIDTGPWSYYHWSWLRYWIHELSPICAIKISAFILRWKFISPPIERLLCMIEVLGFDITYKFCTS